MYTTVTHYTGGRRIHWLINQHRYRSFYKLWLRVEHGSESGQLLCSLHRSHGDITVLHGGSEHKVQVMSLYAWGHVLDSWWPDRERGQLLNYLFQCVDYIRDIFFQKEILQSKTSKHYSGNMVRKMCAKHGKHRISWLALARTSKWTAIKNKLRNNCVYKKTPTMVNHLIPKTKQLKRVDLLKEPLEFLRTSHSWCQ